MRYLLVFLKEFADALEKLDPPTRFVVEKRIKRIQENPLFAKPLHGEPHFYRDRFLHYRVIYKVVGNKVLFYRLGKRDEVYRGYSFG